jgi:hypothetical protein
LRKLCWSLTIKPFLINKNIFFLKLNVVYVCSQRLNLCSNYNFCCYWFEVLFEITDAVTFHKICSSAWTAWSLVFCSSRVTITDLVKLNSIIFYLKFLIDLAGSHGPGLIHWLEYLFDDHLMGITEGRDKWLARLPWTYVWDACHHSSFVSRQQVSLH